MGCENTAHKLHDRCRAECGREECNRIERGDGGENVLVPAAGGGINGVVVGTTHSASSQTCYHWHWPLYNACQRQTEFSSLKAGWRGSNTHNVFNLDTERSTKERDLEAIKTATRSIRLQDSYGIAKEPVDRARFLHTTPAVGWEVRSVVEYLSYPAGLTVGLNNIIYALTWRKE